MKKFINKLLLFVGIYLTIAFLIRFYTPYYWGNPWYSSKINYIENNNLNNFNIFFFGSSTVSRQISPRVFDSIVNSKKGMSIKSFNLGAPGTFSLQNFYLYENFLNSDLSKNVEYCFFELKDNLSIGTNVMHQERSNYWLNFKYTKLSLSALQADNNLGVTTKVFYSSKYLISFLENIFKYGHFGELIKDGNYYNERFIGKSKRGYFPLEEDFKTTNDQNFKQNLITRKREILENPELLNSTRKKMTNISLSKNSEYNNALLKKINEIILKSEQKGIRIFFIIPPRDTNKNFLSIVKTLNPKYVIDLSNPTTNNEFYIFENSYDRGHLNTQGAMKYSKKIAQIFLEKK